MKIYLTKKQCQGSVLVVSLLILVAGTVGMASMTTLLSARSRLVMDLEFGVQRRTALRNARAMCQHYFMSRGVANSSLAVDLDLGGGWGKVAIPASAQNPLGSQQEFSLKNLLSPGWNRGFTEEVLATVYQSIPYDTTGAEAQTSLRVQLKSRSPLLAGNLLVLHHPMTNSGTIDATISGSVQVNGHATFWKDDTFPGTVGNLKVESYDHPDVISEAIDNIGGNHIPPTNYPFFARSTGYDSVGASGSPLTDGRFNMIQIGTPSASPPDPDAIYKQNTLHHKMTANSSPTVVNGSFDYTVGAVSGDEQGGQRRITIDLNTPAVSPVIVDDGVFYVRFLGYTSGSGDNELPGFVIIRSSDLLSVTFENDNDRRLVVGLQSPSLRNVSVNFTNAVSWRLLLTSQLTSTSWNVPVGDTVNLYGGIRTDSTVNVASGQLVLNRETNPDALELMDPREGWVEIYQN